LGDGECTMCQQLGGSIKSSGFGDAEVFFRFCLAYHLDGGFSHTITGPNRKSVTMRCPFNTQ